MFARVGQIAPMCLVVVIQMKIQPSSMAFLKMQSPKTLSLQILWRSTFIVYGGAYSS